MTEMHKYTSGPNTLDDEPQAPPPADAESEDASEADRHDVPPRMPGEDLTGGVQDTLDSDLDW